MLLMIITQNQYREYTEFPLQIHDNTIMQCNSSQRIMNRTHECFALHIAHSSVNSYYCPSIITYT